MENGKKRIYRREQTGEVISDKMNKTVVVVVKSRIQHPQYGKVLTRRTKFSAHDEKQVSKIGDIVKIRESRPLSKTKTRMTVAEGIGGDMRRKFF